MSEKNDGPSIWGKQGQRKAGSSRAGQDRRPKPTHTKSTRSPVARSDQTDRVKNRPRPEHGTMDGRSRYDERRPGSRGGGPRPRPEHGTMDGRSRYDGRRPDSRGGGQRPRPEHGTMDGRSRYDGRRPDSRGGGPRPRPEHGTTDGRGRYDERRPDSRGGGPRPRPEHGLTDGRSRYDDRRPDSRGGGPRPLHYRDREDRLPQFAEVLPADTSFKLVATCSLGLELVLGRELEALGLGPIVRDNAQVSFPYSPVNLARANYWLRSADRVWLQVSEFPCRDFEELYRGVHAVDWSELLVRDAYFPVESITTKSRLQSVPAISAVAKKAAVQKMSEHYGRTAFPETGARYAIRVFIVADRARVFLDTSGEGLHRRGYRTYSAQAPLRETVAAALVLLSHWSPDRELYDPLCGSGTILLEAAGIGLRKAAGLDRSFASQRWEFLGREPWEQTHKEARDLLVRQGHLRLFGSDHDGRVLKLAREHMAQAGFEGMGINFQNRDLKDFSSARRYGVLITNPPYGRRIGTEAEVAELTSVMASVFEPLHETWSIYFLTAYEGFVEAYGREPERVRKIYNGPIPCQFYQYPGPKPPGRGLGVEGDGQEPIRKRIPLNP